MRPVALSPARSQVGALTYAGGLKLKSSDKAFGGLSGIDVRPDGSFLSQTDAGGLLSGRIVLDAAGRLAAIADVGFASLPGLKGAVQAGARSPEADAEDITYLPTGGYAVAYERDHRVEVVGPGGEVRLLATPPGSKEGPDSDGVVRDNFSANRGLEGLTAWTDPMGRARMVEGAEDGRVWSCDPEGRDCRLLIAMDRDGPDRAFSLSGLDALPDGLGLVAVYRSLDLLHGSRALVAWIRPEAPQRATVIARLGASFMLANMEGIAAVKRPDGSIRLYLVSDDNFNPIQPTLLLAFDWRPARAQGAAGLLAKTRTSPSPSVPGNVRIR